MTHEPTAASSPDWHCAEKAVKKTAAPGKTRALEKAKEQYRKLVSNSHGEQATGHSESNVTHTQRLIDEQPPHWQANLYKHRPDRNN